MAATAIAVSFFVIIVAVAVSAGFRNAIRDGVAAMTGDVRIEPYVSRTSDEPVPMPAHLPCEEQLLSLPGVVGIQPVAVRAGIVNGVDEDGVSYLQPQGTATRAQAAAIIQRFDAWRLK